MGCLGGLVVRGADAGAPPRDQLQGPWGPPPSQGREQRPDLILTFPLVDPHAEAKIGIHIPWGSLDGCAGGTLDPLAVPKGVQA